jgi:hypothetical protein
MLADKLHEFYALNAPEHETEPGSQANQPVPRKKGSKA